MFTALNDEIRITVLKYIEESRKTTRIVSKLNVSKRQIKRIKLNFRLYTLMIPSIMRKNRFRIVDQVMKKELLDWINHRFIMYLNEIYLFLYNEYDIVVII